MRTKYLNIYFHCRYIEQSPLTINQLVQVWSDEMSNVETNHDSSSFFIFHIRRKSEQDRTFCSNMLEFFLFDPDIYLRNKALHLGELTDVFEINIG